MASRRAPYIFKSVAWDLEGRTGRVFVADLCDTALEPIRNPVTGAAHRALIHLPEGFEFRAAEMASATFNGTGALKFDHTGRYGFLTDMTHRPYGIID